MSYAHLRQIVLLDRGMACQLHQPLENIQRELLGRDPHIGQRWTPEEALSLKPLAKLLKRLHTLSLRDLAPLRRPMPYCRQKVRPPRPHSLKVEYDEMTTVRLYYARLLASASYDPEAYDFLATVLGRFHQRSLNLESHIRLPSPTGPGCQSILL